MNIQILSYLVIIVIIFLLIYINIRQRKDHYQEITSINGNLSDAQNSIKSLNKRLASVFQLSYRFVEADREGDIVNYLLQQTMDVSGAMGVSFVPLDNHGQPLTAARIGEFPFPIQDAWLEYLASPKTRSDCLNCTKHNSIVETCPLLKGPFSDALGIFCLPLKRGDREYGVLNIYLPDPSILDDDVRIFIKSLTDATALILEGIRQRKSEQETLEQLRTVQQQADIDSILGELIKKACVTLQADFGLLLPQLKLHHDIRHLNVDDQTAMTYGEIPTDLRRKLNHTSQEIYKIGEAINKQMTLDSGRDILGSVNIIGMPILTVGKIPIGVLLVGKTGPRPYKDDHVGSLRAISDQIGLVLQTSNHLAEIAYKTMMDERLRLAREIHDGLAQTLGSLKLLVAQMQSHINRGDYERVNDIALTCYQSLSDAYLDAREAIDGLRVLPTDKAGHSGLDLSSWLHQTVSEFQENQDLNPFVITLETDECNYSLPTEVQAQLIRIVQEALSNVRKHSKADHVLVIFREHDDDLIMEIRDNGYGFSPDDVPGSSKHGLKGMRERSELIGADFQVISLPGDGTKIHIRLPGSTIDKWKIVNESN